MFFRQFYQQGLGHASYLVGSEETGEALLFDPQRDVSGYFAEARVQGLRVRHALDSHGHNDYLSGLTEVGERGDVEILASSVADVGFDHRRCVMVSASTWAAGRRSGRSSRCPPTR